MAAISRIECEYFLHKMRGLVRIDPAVEDFRMDGIGSQSWVVSKLMRDRHRLREIPDAALARFNKVDPELRLPLNPRTTANMLNCYVIDEARRAFDRDSRSRFIDANGTTYQILGECVLWYKQLGDDGLPSNYPTDAALEMMQGSFPFAPHKYLLVVGIQVDATMQKVERVEIQRYTAAGKIQFYIELEKAERRGRVLGMPSAEPAAKSRSRVTIKRGPEQTEIASGEK